MFETGRRWFRVPILKCVFLLTAGGVGSLCAVLGIAVDVLNQDGLQREQKTEEGNAVRRHSQTVYCSRKTKRMEGSLITTTDQERIKKTPEKNYTGKSNGRIQ